MREVGAWLDRYGECIYDTDMFTYGLMSREGHNGDWSHNGPFTLKGKSLYQIVKCWPGSELVIAGLNAEVQHVTLLGQGGPQSCTFTQEAGKVQVTGLPDMPPDPICPVVRFDCREVPEMYLAGGMRTPRVPHPPDDPCPSDIAH